VFSLDLLAPWAGTLEPALCQGEWTVLAWFPDVPEEAKLVAHFGRALSNQARTPPPGFLQRHFAVRPVRSREELTAWSQLDLITDGPYWFRLRDGTVLDYCTRFSPPDDWLGGVSL
jgi:hypothetical protein